MYCGPRMRLGSVLWSENETRQCTVRGQRMRLVSVLWSDNETRQCTVV